MERFDCIVVGCDWDHFSVGVHLRELSSSRVHGGGRGWLSYLSGVKRVVLYLQPQMGHKGRFRKIFEAIEQKENMSGDIGLICSRFYHSF